MKTDIVLGLVFGDEAKSKVVNDLIKHGDYTHCLRFCGGENAGHTVYINDKKVITHAVPTGALSKIRSIVGPGCVIHPKHFLAELDELSKIEPDIHKYVKVAKNTHIVTDKHLKEDSSETKIGTTRRGIGPAYRDKHARIGIRAEDVPELKDYIIDMHEEFYGNDNATIIAEGAQALFLDIDWGEYPFVTSSHCGVGAVINNGISYKSIRKVIGVGKCYETYVGKRKFQDPKNPVLKELAKVGEEFGATTGRLRQVNFLNINRLEKAINLSGADQVILNKLDIVRKVDVWKVIKDDQVIDLKNEDNFKTYLLSKFGSIGLIFSESPYEI